MTHTATPIIVEEGVALYELDPLMVVAGHPIRYVGVLEMPGSGRHYPDQTLVYAADQDGLGDGAFFSRHGYISEQVGYADIPRAMKILGYEVAPKLSLVKND
jgi:hypothetical protein